MPGHVLGVRLRSAKRLKTLVRRMANQGLQTQTNGFCIGGGAAGQLGLFEEAVIDVEGFPHANSYTVQVWLSTPYRCVHEVYPF